MTTKLLKTVADHRVLRPKRHSAFRSDEIDRRPREDHCGEAAEEKYPQLVPEQKCARN